MRIVNFDLSLQQVSAEETGVAVFAALLSAAWSVYEARLMIHIATGNQLPPLETRIEWAKACFTHKAAHIPPGSPYRREFERYIDEAIPAGIDSAGTVASS